MKVIYKERNGERFLIVAVTWESALGHGKLEEIRRDLPRTYPSIGATPLILAWQDNTQRLFFDGGTRQDIQDFVVLNPPRYDEFLDWNPPPA